MTEHPMTEATPLASEQITQPKKLKPQYPDYLDDPDGLARFRDQVRHQNGHDMAICNNNSLGRLIDTIERLRVERDAALSASPAPSGQGVSGEVWQHVKRGTSYEVVGRAELQNGNVKGLREGVTLVVYRGDDGKLWAREEGEFTDGRFVRVAAPTPSCAPGEVERLTQALRDVVNPLGYLQRIAEAEGSKLGGMAYAIANDLATVQRIASDALSPQRLDAKEGQ